MVKAMKKKFAVILATALTAQLAPALPAGAVDTTGYDVYIEAEDQGATLNSNWTETETDANASGGKYLALYKNTTPEQGYYYTEYSVSVSTAGVYDLDLASSPILNSSWSSDIYISVNNGMDVKLTGEQFGVVTSQCNWYHADAVNLNKGVNSIKFKITAPRSDGYYVAFFDAFGLTKSTSKVRYITSDAPFNVFEQSDEIVMKIQMNNLVTQNTAVAWSAVDVHGASVGGGTVTVQKGNNSASLSLHNLPKGYYEVTASGLTTGLCVVKPLEERTQRADTPFAVDVAYGLIYNRIPYYASDYARVLALSGVSWIRDRANFKDLATYTNGDFSISNGYLTASGSLVKSYGIKVSAVAENVPDVLMGAYSKAIPDNLGLSYKLWKKIAEKFDGYVDNWEIMNESDLGGLTASYDSPDAYAAYMKAAALGIADANKSSVVTAMTQGASERITSDGEYIRMLMRNGVFDYSAADNTHAHNGVNKPYEEYYQYPGMSDSEKHVYYQNLLGAVAPIWVTESGIAIASDTPGNFSRQEQMVQAKYAVTSAVESISSGTDKHFFFIGPNYNEGVSEWGMMSKDLVDPYMYASLSAQSAMTDILGEGKYVGKITGVPAGIHAYEFRTEDKTVAVLWSEVAAASVALGETPVAVYDMFGNEKAATGTICVTDEPTYAVFSASLGGTEYNRRAMQRAVAPTFDDAKKVIISQKYSDAERGAARFGGYTIEGDSGTVTVDVTNLTQKTMSGKINAEFERGWSLDIDSQDITLAAGEKKSLTFTFNTRYDIPFDYLSFYGVFNGKKTSVSAAKLNSYNGDMVIEAEEDASYCDDVFVKGSGSMAASQVSSDSVIVFKPFISKSGMYNIKVFATGDYKIYLNQTEVFASTGAASDWGSIDSIYLDKGNNELKFVALGTGGAASLDKLIISEPKGNGLWIEAEDYSEKSGYFMQKANADASNGYVMKNFTFGIDDPYTGNKLSYDFTVEEAGKYDVWILSTESAKDYVTKWKFGLDSGCAYPSSTVRKIKSDYAEGNVNMYWHRVKSNTTLSRGIHNLTILSDEERASGDYMLHAVDAIVISETGSWMPTGIVAEDRESYRSLHPDSVNVTFSDSRGEPVEKVTGDTDISVKINNTLDRNISMKVYCATYNAFTGKLMDVTNQSVDISQGGTDMVNLKITPADNDLTPYTYKVFSWEGDMVPYATSSTINSEWDTINKPVKLNNRLYISGNIGRAGEHVSVMVLKPTGVSYEEMDALELFEAIEYVDEVKADFDGDFLIKINTDMISEGSVIRIGSKSTGMTEQMVQ